MSLDAFRVPATVAGVGFVLFVILLFPARAAFYWFMPDGVQAAAVTGRIWSGQAQGLSSQGAPLGDLRWDLSPLGLLLLSVRGDFRLEQNGGFCEGYARLGLSGAVDLSPLSCLSALDLQGYLPGVSGSAQVSAKLEHLRLQGDWPVSAQGEVVLGQLALEFPGTGMDGLRIPAIDVELAPGQGAEAEGMTLATFNDRGGPVQLAGQVTLSDQRAWRADGSISLRDRSRTDLEAGLAFLGPADPQGVRQFTLEGEL